MEILSDAWGSMIAETKLATEDQPRMLVKEPLAVECRKNTCKAHGHMGSCPGYELLILHGKATQPREDQFRKRIGRIIERTLAGEARMETYKDRIEGRKRVREKRRARIERGTGDVPQEPRNKNDEQVAVRHADASGGYIMENQHEDKIMRGIRVDKEDHQEQRAKNNWKNGGRENDLSVRLRTHEHLPIHVLPWNIV